MDLILNLLICALMLGVLIRFSRKDGRWTAENLRPAFRYFTVQSNAFCAAAALLLCLFPDAAWAWTLKFVATAAVTVTMLTVLCFLGRLYGYRALLQGSDLIMHLINPLLALVSFCGFERRGLRFPLLLAGLIPVLLYGAHYFYRILLCAPEKRWEDFYGFNRGGRWYVSLPAMLSATLLICLGLAALQNL